LVGCALAAVPAPGQEKVNAVKPVPPQVKCADRDSKDQDDLCIWVHPTDPSQSLIITSDKKAHKLFVYDLAGNTLQSIPAQHPGNIDVRYGFPLGGHRVDIVAFNQRQDPRVLVYKVDGKTRQLQRVDNAAIRTAENYGGTLYRSPKTGKFYFLTTSKGGDIEQYELADDGTGSVAGKKVRRWRIAKSEAAVADDEAGKVYIGEEDKGVWEVGGEPDDPTPGQLVIRLGANGLTGDVEGLALYPLPGGGGYLIVSNQGSSNFKVYQRAGAHEFVGTFAVQGATKTDGLDVCNANLGPPFAQGLFACHTEEGNCPVLLTRWDAIARAASSQLKVDTSWDRRK
jgi:3-phytase